MVEIYTSHRSRAVGNEYNEPARLTMFDDLKAVFFDVDGVLIDSLSQHLQICRDKAAEFGLDIKIPNAAEMRRKISAGLKVSPMTEFFLAVGFPRVLAERAFIAYQRDFMENYRPSLFGSVYEMLATLRGSGLKLGLVTSNTRANVVPVLGDAMNYFEEPCLFFFDQQREPMSKSWCLSEGARLMSLAPAKCTYVGDQPSDAAAARQAGVQFLGVTYGWGILEGSRAFPTAGSVSDIAIRLIGRQHHPHLQPAN